ncbi:MAG: DNA translocase FtsK 4TM domain-containing protein [Rhizobiaceae bacterium]|nr:DNA translocase FtsK 4TM domain-containing protein [Rhizobiaceae bacterium]
MRTNPSPGLMLDHARSVASDFIRRQILRAGGAVALAGALCGTAALATWNIADPSLNHATGNPVTNAMGAPGAVFADVATQLFGLGALPAMLPLAALGVTLLRGQPAGSARVRLRNAVLAVFVLCAALACLSRPATWPLPSGLGGLMGDLILKPVAAMAGGYPSGAPGMLLAALIALPGLWMLLGAMTPRLAKAAPKSVAKPSASGKAGARGPTAAARTAPIPFDDDTDTDDDEDGGSPFAGAVLHHWFSLKARLGLNRPRSARSAETRTRRFFAGASDDDDGQPIAGIPTKPAAQRIEPDLDRSQAAPPRPPVLRAAQPAPSMETPVFDEDELLDSLADEGLAAPVVSRGPRAAPPAASVPRGPAVDAVAAPPKPGQRQAREAQGSLLKPDAYELPQLALLAQPRTVVRDARMSKEALEENARILEGVLDDFGVKGEIIHVRPGPVVTLYELEPAPGIKSSRVIGLADDIARSMSAIACRVAVVPGRNAIGIELPNDRARL